MSPAAADLHCGAVLRHGTRPAGPGVHDAGAGGTMIGTSGSSRPGWRAGMALLALCSLAPAASAQTITRGPLDPESRRAHHHHDDPLVDGRRRQQHGRVRHDARARVVGHGADRRQLRGRRRRHLPHRAADGPPAGHALLLPPPDQRRAGAAAEAYFTDLRDAADPSDLFFTVVGDWGQGSSAARPTSPTSRTRTTRRSS